MALPIPLDSDSFALEAQGRVLKLTVRRNRPADAPPPAKRGDVVTFSRKSRKRLLDMFNRFSFHTDDTKFLTLTHAGCPTYAEAKANLRAFLERLRRKYPAASAVWRQELQARGSIHFHLVTFGMPFFEQRKLQTVWTQCTGEERSIVHIKKVDSQDHMISYVSKYVAKEDKAVGTAYLDKRPYLHAKDLGKPGRAWGMHNRDALPLAEFREITFNNVEAEKYLRFAMRAMSAGYASGNKHGATLWHKDAYAMLAHARQLAGVVEARPSFEAIKWHFVKHGPLTVTALSEIHTAYITVGESVQSLTEALTLVSYRMQTATPQQRLAAAKSLFNRSAKLPQCDTITTNRNRKRENNAFTRSSPQTVIL